MGFSFGKSSQSSSASNQTTTTTTNANQTDNRTVQGDGGFQVQAGQGSTLSFVLPKNPAESSDSTGNHDLLAAIAANSAASHPDTASNQLLAAAQAGDVAGAAGAHSKLPWYAWVGIAIGGLAVVGIGAKALMGGKRG